MHLANITSRKIWNNTKKNKKRRDKFNNNERKQTKTHEKEEGVRQERSG